MSAKPEHYDLIKKPVITEKATMASEAGAVVFQVAMTRPSRRSRKPSRRSSASR
jgi:ribosomal protein L23